MHTEPHAPPAGSSPAPAHPTLPQVSPVALLGRLTASLDAAITLAVADPQVEPVHRLRTTTRRIEAQLTLLHVLAKEQPQFGGQRGVEARVRRLLKRVRRAAGKVRDLDVQRDMLESLLEAGVLPVLAVEAEILRERLQVERVSEAACLQQSLPAAGLKLNRRLGEWLEALAPASELQVSAARVEQAALGWYGAREPLRRHASADELHDVRKAAKLARYVAEAARTPGTRAESSARFEALQKAGGAWHDLLMLEETARKVLGKRSSLVRQLKEERARALAAYQALLVAFANPG